MIMAASLHQPVSRVCSATLVFAEHRDGKPLAGLGPTWKGRRSADTGGCTEVRCDEIVPVRFGCLNPRSR